MSNLELRRTIRQALGRVSSIGTHGELVDDRDVAIALLTRLLATLEQEAQQ